MRSQSVSIRSASGHELAAILDTPDEPARAWGLFAHCFTCSKNLRIVSTITRTLAAEGLATLRFDFTGLGQSEGDFAETTFTTNLDDLVAAAGYLEAERGAPAFLVGHSLGGAAVLAVARRLESVRCVATIGAPSDPGHVRHLIEGADFDARGRARVDIGGRPFEIGREFVEDLETHDLPALVGTMRRPLLVFHSPADTIVGVDHAERIFKAAKHPKSFVSLGEADHLVTDEGAGVFLGHVLSAWAGYYSARSPGSVG